MNTAIAFLEGQRHRLSAEGHQIPSRLSSLLLTPRFQASRHVVFLLLPTGSRDLALVAKIPRVIDTHASLEREAASLRAVQAMRPGGFDSVPRLIAFEEYCGRPILIETALPGPPMDPAFVRRHRDQSCTAAVAWLVEMQRASATAADLSWFTRVVDAPLRQFAETFPVSRDEDALICRTRALIEPLRDARLPFVCEHGDLSHPNLVRLGRDTLGVVDWELAQTAGQVTYDLFIFLAYVAFSLENAHSIPHHVAAFRRAFFGVGPWALPYVARYARECGVPPALLTPLFVTCWARYAITLWSRVASADSPGDTPSFGDTATWLRSNRYYHLWRDAVEHADRLVWSH